MTTTFRKLVCIIDVVDNNIDQFLLDIGSKAIERIFGIAPSVFEFEFEELG